MIATQNKTTTLYSYQNGIGANTEAILTRTLRHILYGDLYVNGGNGGNGGGGEIPSDEMHFTTLAGSVDYVGTQGDQILLSDNSIVDITATGQTFTFNAPAGRHVVTLVESSERSNYVSVGGEALVELHNFPALSTVTKFNFTTGNYNQLPNLTKVPELFPSNIIDMSDMFNGTTSFNQPLNNWNVSNVTNMGSVFYNATSFNQDISMWDVSNVTSMYGMFGVATSFNQPLNNWDVSNVTRMDGMFEHAYAFNQDLNNWNVSNVTNMDYMFSGASAFNQQLNNWNVSNVTNMGSVFNGTTSFNQPLNNWDVSSVIEMNYMFSGASAFNQQLNNWDVSSVINMNSMFANASSFNQDLSMWCVSNFPTMPVLFDFEATNWTLPRPVWGTCPAP